MTTRKELIVANVNYLGEKFIRVDGYVHYTVDKSYGADADGNRGEVRTVVEDVKNVQAYDINDDEINLTPVEVEKAEEALVCKFMEG